MNDNQKGILAIGTTVAVVVGVALNYVKVARTERQKRAKIEEWKLENLACIKNSHDRLIEMAQSSNTSFSDLIAALNEETRFLNIVKNQPMY